MVVTAASQVIGASWGCVKLAFTYARVWGISSINISWSWRRKCTRPAHSNPSAAQTLGPLCFWPREQSECWWGNQSYAECAKWQSLKYLHRGLWARTAEPTGLKTMWGHVFFWSYKAYAVQCSKKEKRTRWERRGQLCSGNHLNFYGKCFPNVEVSP